jgi:putative solute:sodium symporter small subunit
MAEATQTSLPGGGTPPPEGGSSGDNGWRKEYWRRNLRLMLILLSIWFVVSFVCGVLLIEPLNEIVIYGFPLGLWFAQQGSIYTFVILIYVYAKRMDRLDDEYGVGERDGEGRRL